MLSARTSSGGRPLALLRALHLITPEQIVVLSMTAMIRVDYQPPNQIPTPCTIPTGKKLAAAIMSGR
jgi:hypothetical protein